MGFALSKEVAGMRLSSPLGPLSPCVSPQPSMLRTWTRPQCVYAPEIAMQLRTPVCRFHRQLPRSHSGAVLPGGQPSRVGVVVLREERGVVVHTSESDDRSGREHIVGSPGLVQDLCYCTDVTPGLYTNLQYRAAPVARATAYGSCVSSSSLS